MPFSNIASTVALFYCVLAVAVGAQPRPRGSFHVGVGYFSTPNLYDETGDVVDTGVDFSALTAELGGEFIARDRAEYDVIVGGAMHFARATLDSGTTSTEMTSGFTPQNLVLQGRLASERFAISAGASFDIGKNPEDATPPSTDGQHAILLGASVAVPAGKTLRLTAAGNAYLTFARSVEGMASVSIDDGDVFSVYLDGQYPIGPLRVGIRAQYVTITDITRTTDGTEVIFPDSDSYQLAFVPSVSIHPPNTPIHISLLLGARSGAVQEYVDYGVALTGKNVAATRLPLSLRLRFDF